ncbi:MAG TPA: site-specific integrase [Nevskiaceae bacterium]|nr:site-specific integrase [Nevskiaceae bacterium]
MNLPENYRTYLKTQGLSSVTIKNYVADINHFLDWLYQKTHVHHRVAGIDIFGLFTTETFKEYKADVAEQNTPLTTINRRLSALRKFGQFGLQIGSLNQNPVLKIKNVVSESNQSPKQNWLVKFRKSLEEEKVSPLTIKNYLSDLRHFLTWLEAT